MHVKIVKLLPILIFCTLLMFLLSCVKVLDITGSMSGRIVLQPSEDPDEVKHVDTWPGDTTSIAVCLLDASGAIIFNDEGEDKCCYEKPDTAGSEAQAAEIIPFNFQELPWGEYHLGIYFQHGDSGPEVEKELITYYHPELETTGPITDFAESAPIILSLEHRIADLGDIIIRYGLE
jgi:hypothetical protein